MKQAYMIVHELDVNKGGMTTAMLTRSKYFLDHKIKGHIVTFDYKIHYDSILKSLVSSNKMDKRTEMFNPFIYFKKKSNKLIRKKNSHPYKELAKMLKGTVEIKQNKNISKFFNNKSGEYIAYKRKINRQQSVIDVFENNTRLKRVYLFNNKIHKVDVFNKDNKLVAEQFYDNQTYLYLYRQISAKNGVIGNTYLINEKKQFSNNVEFCSYFLDRLVKDDKNSIMICDGPGSFPKMLNTKHKKAKKFSVIHTNHHKNFDNSGAKKKHEDYILKKAGLIDGVIVLTEGQKKDIIKEYDIKNLYVISNFIDIQKDDLNNKHHKVVGQVSRLVATKGLNYLLEVAEKVISKDNSIEFHIYGDGPEKGNLERMIKEKQLQHNVKLLGYTNEPLKKIKKFGCVVSTSQVESQGLSIAEAMLQRKPVVAFDIKYGPSDFIKDGENGYLTENKDIESMAEKVLEIINNKDLANRLGENARNNVVGLFSPEKIMNQWLNIFK